MLFSIEDDPTKGEVLNIKVSVIRERIESLWKLRDLLLEK